MALEHLQLGLLEKKKSSVVEAIAKMSKDESLDNASSEYDPTTYIQSLQFKLRCYEASGDDFQRLFEEIVKRARPEFMQIRPYGNIGDRKCDGLLDAGGTIFQVYSPNELKQAQLKKKINEDLDGAVKHWGDTLKKWVFVYNARGGLAPDIPKILQQKQKQYPNIEIDHWSNHYLWEMARGLSLQQRVEILGAPVVEKLEQLVGFNPQKNAVCQFLEDIENDERFKYIGFFHTPQEVVLKEQYISIQVTLESKRKDVENFWQPAESEAELKRAYALKGMDDESQRSQVDWEEAKKQHKRIMVLADPGMGKSTLLKMEAVLTAQVEKQKLLENEITIDEVIFPLFLRLSDLVDEKVEEIFKAEIIDAIPILMQRDYSKAPSGITYLLKEKFKAGKCLLLLDALDEVPREHRNRLKDKLNRFVQTYPCQIICTSRIVGYDSAFVNGAKEVEIVPFKQKQTEQYIKIWFTNAVDYIDNDLVSANGLIRELQNKPQIRGLAQNPLLLSLLCSLYQEKELTLPAQRCQIYEKAVLCMLSKWTRNRNSQSEGKIRAKIRVLEELAYQFTCEGKEIFLPDELYDKIEAYLQEGKTTVFRDTNTDELMTELSEEDGIIQKLSSKDDRYLFVHRTFQEYFTACYLKRAIQKNQSDGIALATEHFWEYDWHETLSLLAGLMQEPIPLLQAITAEKDDIFSTLLLLAGRCVAECKENSDPLIAEIIDRIYDLWKSYPNAGFIKSIVVLIGQANSQMSHRLQKAVNDSKTYVRMQAAVVLGKIGNAQAVKVLIAALSDSETYVRMQATMALGKIGNAQAVEALIAALNDSDRDMRRQAVVALGKIGNTQAVEALIAALNHSDWNVRLKATAALGKIGNAQAVEALIAALNHSDWNVRLKATVALGKIGNAQAVEALIAALNDSDRNVRMVAAMALGEIGNAQAVEALIAALNDSETYVRMQATMALGKISNAQAVEVLIAALNDSDRNVRMQAVVALGKIGNAQAVEALIAALNASDRDVRMQAIVALGKIGNAQAVEVLIAALNDSDSLMRSQAARDLGKIGTSETLAKLIQLPEISIYDAYIFLLARTLAVRFSKERLPFIPVYPELVAHKQ